MALVTDSVFLDTLLALVPLLYWGYWFVTYNDDYWDKRGVPNTKKGNLLKFLLGIQSQAESCIELYNKFSAHRFYGIFNINKPIIMIRDPQLIHKVLVKDFIHFQDRGGAPEGEDKKTDPFQSSLFGLRGQIWRALRYKLTPTFTTGKLRMMFEQISKSGDNMMEKIQSLAEKNNESECKTFIFEFTLDVISSCAFGLQFKPNSTEFNIFKTTVEKMFNTSVSALIKFTILTFTPKLAKLLGMRTFPKASEDYFLNLTKTTFKYRKDNDITRNDYFQLLMTLKEQEDSGKEMVSITSADATEDDAVIDQMNYAEQNGKTSDVNIKLMTEEAICANSFIFLTAGSESTANAISFTLLNLAQHPAIQLRLQQEVDSALKIRRGWSYDTVKDMTYLDQVIQETQRMYPLLPILGRECVLPYKVPGSDLVIEKGMMVFIPVAGLHSDPQYYHEPDRFNPNRFQGNNFKPSPYFLPFGDGPRICIAMRFAVMEVKTCVARIMSQYSVKLSPKTQTPIKLKKRSFFPVVEGGIWLNFEKRELVSK